MPISPELEAAIKRSSLLTGEQQKLLSQTNAQALPGTKTELEHKLLEHLNEQRQDRLRETIQRDPQLLDQLNQDAAANGHLHDFKLAEPGAANRVGIYKNATVTLPADSFDAGSTHLNATLRVQHMSIEFAHNSTDPQTGRPISVPTPEMVANLQKVLNGSPVLAEQLQKAVNPATGPADELTKKNRAPLEHIKLTAEQGIGGGYRPGDRTMVLPLAQLTRQGPGASFSERDLTFVLGHEIQHSLNGVTRSLTEALLLSYMEKTAQSRPPPPPHNYSKEFHEGLAMHRWDEASAQIAGWNALVSREEQLNPNKKVGLNDMLYLASLSTQQDGTWRVRDFVRENPLKPGQVEPLPGPPALTFNRDLTLDATQNNIKAQGRDYFDKSATQANLGPGHVDYANYYGAILIGQIIETERRYNPPDAQGKYQPIEVDLQTTQFKSLSEPLLEQAGITLTDHPQARQPYIDNSGPLPPPVRYFDNTGQTHRYVPAPPTMPHASQPAPMQTPDNRGVASNFAPAQNPPTLSDLVQAWETGRVAGVRETATQGLPEVRDFPATTKAQVDDMERLTAKPDPSAPTPKSPQEDEGISRN
jgi:hypothetical protein